MRFIYTIILIFAFVNCTVIPDEITITVEVPTVETVEAETVDEEEPVNEPEPEPIVEVIPEPEPKFNRVEIVTDYGTAEIYETASQSEWQSWKTLVPQRCEQLTIQRGFRHWAVWYPL